MGYTCFLLQMLGKECNSLAFFDTCQFCTQFMFSGLAEMLSTKGTLPRYTTPNCKKRHCLDLILKTEFSKSSKYQFYIVQHGANIRGKYTNVIKVQQESDQLLIS